MSCDKCADTKYVSKTVNADGSVTFAVCPCTGINAESLQEFADYLGKNGEMAVEMNSDGEDTK